MTVIEAFDKFMKEKVNLDSELVKKARKSRDNLLDNIQEFSGNNFFDLYKDINIQFGSFARKTKCRELDDIDLMIGLMGAGASYYSNDNWDNVKINANMSYEYQKECSNLDGTLNSIKVIEKFKIKLKNVREYKKSEINRRSEAVVLNLVSKDWSFDIVPCFITVEESNGKNYYLIPNGDGNWKKTDPRKDKEKVTEVNQKFNGKVLELIRLAKKWNKENGHKISSYLLETMIINFCEKQGKLEGFVDLDFRNLLQYISNNIFFIVEDMKEIQENINTLSNDEKEIIKEKTLKHYEKATEAIEYERNKEYEKSIKKWKEIFGEDFPDYE